MITKGRRFFLSRPRRFGKSLLVSTLKEILTNNKKLFDNLWISHSDYQWQKYGVITLDVFEKQPSLVFEKLINALSVQFSKIAILIDEYDSPKITH
ncbi:MAG TPA: AAA family ATPase [Candidatus Babeliales bacterium]|nr:AAA family ATPase [Candidatus Babeliales bacterium]